MKAGKQKVGAYLFIRGETFSPSRAEQALGIDFGPETNEPGEIGTTGKYFGKPTPYGSARWELSWKDDTGGFLPASLEIFGIRDLSSKLRTLDADEVTLYVHCGYEEQCNFELSPTLLNLLAGIGVTVAVSCYRLDDD